MVMRNERALYACETWTLRQRDIETDIRKFSNSSHPLFMIVATHVITSKRWMPEFWLSAPGVEPWTPSTVLRMYMHAMRELVF